MARDVSEKMISLFLYASRYLLDVNFDRGSRKPSSPSIVDKYQPCLSDSNVVFLDTSINVTPTLFSTYRLDWSRFQWLEIQTLPVSPVSPPSA
jgi:hypothetical protein